jgi:23S rRNA (cytosine1962-C5)-methyltransferase
MKEFPLLTLRKGKDAAILRKHPWVFSGAIHHIEGDPQDGDIIWLANHKKEILATGFFHEGKIKAQLFSFSKIDPTQEFWNEKIAQAWKLRQQLGLTDDSTTNAFRLIHGEGDGLPGLVVDIYDEVAVIQAHSIGMHLHKAFFATAIRQALGERIKAIYDASAQQLPADYAAGIQDEYLWGEADSPTEILENNLRFQVDWKHGQKTGFFLDQRENRALLARYAQGKKVLNTFCYTGGFSVYALDAGASQVDSVDSSAPAIALCEANVEVNSHADNHHAHRQDVMDFLKTTDANYDLVILDPPAYAKSFKARHRGVIGYKRLNKAGIQKLTPGGILFTFSCSQVVDPVLFQNTVIAAALETGRTVQILHRLTQPADHPVSLFHPEGQYLKGLVLRVL